ncbi:MAG: hypothetical protein AAFR28_00120 [Pseudomonadota bacterium]
MGVSDPCLRQRRSLIVADSNHKQIVGRVNAGSDPAGAGSPIEVSFAEWKYENRLAEEAADSGEFAKAARIFRTSASIAERFLWLADRGRFDPFCAVSSFVSSKEGEAGAYRSLSDREAFLASANQAFMQICLRAAWPCTSPLLRRACQDRISSLLDFVSKALNETASSPAKQLAARAIAEQSKRQSRQLSVGF